MRHGKSSVEKAIAGVLIPCLIFTSLAVTPEAKASSVAPFSVVPGELGSMIDLSPQVATLQHFAMGETSSSPLLVVIEDAHRSYEAQKNIAKSLMALKSKGVLGALLMEGAAGELNGSRLRVQSDTDAQRAFTGKLLEKGVINGASYFLSEAPDTKAFGSEDAAAYRRDLEAFRVVRAGGGKIERFLVETRSVLSERSGREIGKEGLRLIRLYETLVSSKTDFDKDLPELLSLAQARLGISWKDVHTQAEWPSLVRVYWLFEKEKKKIDPAALEKEIRSLGPEFLADPAMAVLKLRLMHENETGGMPVISGPSFRGMAEKLMQKFIARGIPALRFPQLAGALTQSILSEELEPGALHNETVALIERLAADAFRNKTAQRIWQTWRALTLVQNALHLELDRASVRDLARMLDADQGSEDLTLKDLLGGNEDVSGEREILEKLNSALDFYRIAEEREAPFWSHLLSAMRSVDAKKAVTVVVTGGYHTAGWEEKARKEGFAYAVLRPSFRVDSKEVPYEKRLLGDYTDISSIPSAQVLVMDPKLATEMLPGPEEYEVQRGLLEERVGPSTKTEAMGRSEVRKADSDSELAQKANAGVLSTGGFFQAALRKIQPYVFWFLMLLMNFVPLWSQAASVRTEKERPVAALTVSEKRALTPEQLTELFMRHDTEIQIAGLRSLTESLRASALRGPWNMKMDAEMEDGQPKIGKNSRLSLGAGITDGLKIMLNLDLSYAYKYLSGMFTVALGERQIACRIAEELTGKYSIAKFREALNEGHLNAMQLFIQLRVLEEQRTVYQTSGEELRDYLKQSRVQYESGVTSWQDFFLGLETLSIDLDREVRALDMKIHETNGKLAQKLAASAMDIGHTTLDPKIDLMSLVSEGVPAEAALIENALARNQALAAARSLERVAPMMRARQRDQRLGDTDLKAAGYFGGGFSATSLGPVSRYLLGPLGSEGGLSQLNQMITSVRVEQQKREVIERVTTARFDWVKLEGRLREISEALERLDEITGNVMESVAGTKPEDLAKAVKQKMQLKVELWETVSRMTQARQELISLGASGEFFWEKNPAFQNASVVVAGPSVSSPSAGAKPARKPSTIEKVFRPSLWGKPGKEKKVPPASANDSESPEILTLASVPRGSSFSSKKSDAGMIASRALSGESQRQTSQEIASLARDFSSGGVVATTGSGFIRVSLKKNSSGAGQFIRASNQVLPQAPSFVDPVKPSGAVIHQTSGETVPLAWGGDSLGIQIPAPFQGTSSLLGSGQKDFAAGENFLALSGNVSSESEIVKIDGELKALQTQYDKWSASPYTPLGTLLPLEAKIQALRSHRNELFRAYKDMGLFEAPYPLRVVTAHQGNIGKGEPVVEILPKDRIRLDVTVPLNALGARHFWFEINGKPVNILSWQSISDPKVGHAVLTFELLLKEPLADPQGKVRYQFSFYNGESAAEPKAIAAEEGTVITGRVSLRESIPIPAPQVGGKFEVVIPEAGPVQTGDIVAAGSENNSVDNELEAIQTMAQKIDGFLAQLKPGIWTEDRKRELRSLGEELKERGNALSSANTTVTAGRSGVVVNTYKTRGLGVPGGTPIGEILTNRVLIGGLKTVNDSSMLLVPVDTRVEIGMPVTVTSPSGRELVGRIYAVNSHLTEGGRDLTQYQAVQVLVIDREGLFQPFMPVRVTIPEKDAPALRRRLAEAESQEDKPGDFTPALFQPSPLPTLVELAYLEGGNDIEKRLTELILNEKNPWNQMEGFRYLCNSLRSEHFYEHLQKIILEGGGVAAIAALELLRDEGALMPLFEILDKASVRKGTEANRVGAFAYDLIRSRLAEPFREGSDLLSALSKESRRDPALRKLTEGILLSIVKYGDINSPEVLNILRGDFWTDRELAMLCKSLGQNDGSYLGAVLSDELIRRLALGKASSRDFGYDVRQLLARSDLLPSPIRFILESVLHDRASDTTFLKESSGWKNHFNRTNPHPVIDPATSRETKSSFETLVGRAGKSDVTDPGVGDLRRPGYSTVSPAFEELGLEGQLKYLKDLHAKGRFWELSRILEDTRYKDPFARSIVSMMSEKPEGRLYLARAYSNSGEDGLRQIILGTRYTGRDFRTLLLADTLDFVDKKILPGLSSGQKAAAQHDYGHALVALFRGEKADAGKAHILLGLLALTAHDYELYYFLNPGENTSSWVKFILDSLALKDPGEIKMFENAVHFTIARRALIFGVNLESEAVRATYQGEYKAGHESAVLGEMRQLLDAANFPAFLEDVVAGRDLLGRVEEDFRGREHLAQQVSGNVLKFSGKRMNNVVSNRREATPFYLRLADPASVWPLFLAVLLGGLLVFQYFKNPMKKRKLGKELAGYRPSPEGLRERLRDIFGEIEFQKRSLGSEFSSAMGAVEKCYQILQDRTPLTADRVSELLLMFRRMMNDPDLIYSSQWVTRGHEREFLSEKAVFWMFQQLAIAAQERISMEASADGILQRPDTRTNLSFFAEFALYASGMRAEAQLLNNKKKIDSYSARRPYREGTNLTLYNVMKSAWQIIRLILWMMNASKKASQLFLGHLRQDVLTRGNRLMPGLYPLSGEIFKDSEEAVARPFESQDRPAVEGGVVAENTLRQLLTRFVLLVLPMAAFFGFLGASVAAIFFGWNLVLPILFFILSGVSAWAGYLLHIHPFVEGNRDLNYFWAQGTVARIMTLAGMPVSVREGTESVLQEAMSHEKAVELERDLELFREESSGKESPAVHMIVIAGQGTGFSRAVEKFRKKIRKDVMFLPMAVGKGGDGDSFVQMQLEAQKTYEKERQERKFSHLPPSFDKANVIFFTAANPSYDLLTFLHGTDAYFELPVRNPDGEFATTFEASLGRFVSIAHESRSRGRAVKKMIPMDTFATGRKRDLPEGDIILFGDWVSGNSLEGHPKETIFTEGSAGSTKPWVHLLGRMPFGALIEWIKDHVGILERPQLNIGERDLHNREKRQMAVFRKQIVLNFKDPEREKKFYRYLSKLESRWRDLNNDRAGALPLDLALDVLIPLFRKFQAEGSVIRTIRAYMAFRTESMGDAEAEIYRKFFELLAKDMETFDIGLALFHPIETEFADVRDLKTWRALWSGELENVPRSVAGRHQPGAQQQLFISPKGETAPSWLPSKSLIYGFRSKELSAPAALPEGIVLAKMPLPGGQYAVLWGDDEELFESGTLFGKDASHLLFLFPGRDGKPAFDGATAFRDLPVFPIFREGESVPPETLEMICRIARGEPVQVDHVAAWRRAHKSLKEIRGFSSNGPDAGPRSGKVPRVPESPAPSGPKKQIPTKPKSRPAQPVVSTNPKTSRLSSLGRARRPVVQKPKIETFELTIKRKILQDGNEVLFWDIEAIDWNSFGRSASGLPKLFVNKNGRPAFGSDSSLNKAPLFLKVRAGATIPRNYVAMIQKMVSGEKILVKNVASWRKRFLTLEQIQAVGKSAKPKRAARLAKKRDSAPVKSEKTTAAVPARSAMPAAVRTQAPGKGIQKRSTEKEMPLVNSGAKKQDRPRSSPASVSPRAGGDHETEARQAVDFLEAARGLDELALVLRRGISDAAVGGSSIRHFQKIWNKGKLEPVLGGIFSLNGVLPPTLSSTGVYDEATAVVLKFYRAHREDIEKAVRAGRPAGPQYEGAKEASAMPVSAHKTTKVNARSEMRKAERQNIPDEIRLLTAMSWSEWLLAPEDQEVLLPGLEALMRSRQATVERSLPKLAEMNGRSLKAITGMIKEGIRTRFFDPKPAAQIQNSNTLFLDGRIPFRSEHLIQLVHAPFKVFLLFDRGSWIQHGIITRQLREAGIAPGQGNLEVVYARDGIAAWFATRFKGSFLAPDFRKDEHAFIGANASDANRLKQYIGNRFYYGKELSAEDPDLLFSMLWLLGPKLFDLGARDSKSWSMTEAVDFVMTRLEEALRTAQATDRAA